MAINFTTDILTVNEDDALNAGPTRLRNLLSTRRFLPSLLTSPPKLPEPTGIFRPRKSRPRLIL